MKLDFAKVESAMARIGVNQYDIAKRLDVYPSSISRLMARVRDGQDISPKNVSRIARALKVSIDDLTERAA